MQFEIWTIVFVAILGVVSGLMIGCIGVGGVILVPALVFLGGMPVPAAIAAAMLAYILSGSVATAVFARHKSIDWGISAWLCAGAAPAAFAGAWAVSVVNEKWLEAGIGLLTFLSGLNALRKRQAETELHKVSKPSVLGIGAFTGFLSAMSGTSGPLVLVPILTAMHIPILASIGLSQAVQLPVAIAASAGNFLYGKIDLSLSAILAVALTLGSWYGAKLAHAVPREFLRRIVCAVLIAVGAFILANIFWHLRK
jgi:uncharacterized protein